MTVFAKEGEVVWQCRNCGYIEIGKEAPEVCPACCIRRRISRLRKKTINKRCLLDNKNALAIICKRHFIKTYFYLNLSSL